jgi:hypothetical protein
MQTACMCTKCRNGGVDMTLQLTGTSAAILNAEQTEKRLVMVQQQVAERQPHVGNGHKPWAFDRVMFDGPSWTELRRAGQQRAGRSYGH